MYSGEGRGHWIWTSTRHLKEVRRSSGPPSAVHGHAPRRGQLANARDLQHPWAVRTLGTGRYARLGWEDRRVPAQARTPAASAAASAPARALLPRAVRVRAQALAVQVGALSRAGVRPGRAPPPELGRAIPMMPSHRARLPERGRRRHRRHRRRW